MGFPSPQSARLPGPPERDPYTPPRQPDAGPPHRPKRTLLVALALMGAPVILLLALVGLMALGLYVLTMDVTRLMRDHPTVVQHLGDVRSCELNWGDSMTETRDDYFHYYCVGTKSNARAILHTEATGPEGHEQLVDGTLVLPSGERIALGP